MYGKGLVVGLKVTINRFFARKVTQNYPEVKPDLPQRSHGSFDFQSDKCISCGLCANACPNCVIKVESAKGEDGKKVLQSYRMSLGYCLFCGLCVEACPTKALSFKRDFELACSQKDGTVYTWEGPKAKGNIVTEDCSTGQEADDKEE